MAKLHYGSGKCSIEGAVVGVEIRYRGAVKITKTCGDNCLLVAQNNGIIILSLDGSVINDLFSYNCDIKIISVIASDGNSEKVPTTIKRVMDYSELIDSNSEDMTVNSEKMSAGYSYGAKVKKTSVDVAIVKNQLSDGDLYLKDGTPYHGEYHVHLDGGKAMTGAEHTKESENLYIKRIKDDKITDNKIARFPRSKISKIPQTRKTRKTTSGGTTGGSGGGGY